MNTTTKQFGLKGLALIVVIAALLFGGVSITGVAAQSAIPGDALYPVKTTIEQTRLSLAQDAGDRAQMKMAFAEKRLEEVAALIEEGRYHEVGDAVFAFEADINSAIMEVETVAQADPARGARIALEITSALTRYAQTLSIMAAGAPQSVQADVTRALDTTHTASGLELPSLGDDDGNTNANSNGDDGNANSNGDDTAANTNDDGTNANTNDDGANTNGDDDGTNTNGDDGNSNSNGDDTAANTNDDSANTNGDDGNANTNDAGANANSNDDSANANSNDDSANPSSNANTNDDSGNDNGDDSGGGGHGGNGNDQGNGND